MTSSHTLSDLMKLQPTIMHFVKLLSAVFQIDAEVVDENLVRVAGTGPYSKCLGKKLSSSARLFRYILETQEEKVVITSGDDPLCDGCPSKADCKEMAFLGVPIVVNNRGIGVISLVAFNPEQQERIRNNIQILSEYIRHIAGIFVSKIMAHQAPAGSLNKVFLSLIENMDQGVLVLDNTNHVLFGNQPALGYLNVTAEEIKQQETIIYPLPSSMSNIAGHQRHIISFAGRQELVIGQFHEIQGHQLFLMAFYQPSNHYTLNMDQPQLNHIIGECKKMRMLKTLISRIATSPSSVLITGESGTGKEVVARSIHDASDRTDKPFIAINCASIPDQLLESELFGYVKGAFTGASSTGKTGLICAANNGTLFLDEIGDMSMALQAKLLRVLETREVMPIGSNKTIPVNIRVISATNRDFSKMIAENQFREDLYYRLNVVPVYLPPLRERGSDIELLAHYFLELHSKKIGRNYPGFTKEVISYLMSYSWPGNVRELSNLVEYLVNIVPENDNIDIDLLPPYFELPDQTSLSPSPARDSNMSLEEMEKNLIEEALGRLHNRKLVAEELGIGIATLYRKIKKYNLH